MKNPLLFHNFFGCKLFEHSNPLPYPTYKMMSA